MSLALFKQALEGTDEVEITVIGRSSGRKITNPVWFVQEGDELYLLPVRGSDTDWYRNVLKAPTKHRAPEAAPCAFYRLERRAGCLADLSVVRPDGTRGKYHRSDFVQHAVEAGKIARRADDRCSGVGGQGRVVRSVEVEGHSSADAVHGSAEYLDVVEGRASVGMDDQGALDRRGAAERAGICRRGAEIDDQVAVGHPHAVEGRGRIADGPARFSRR